MKRYRAAVINDLSGLGRCSLEADISVLSAMGISVCPAPTAVLSAHTAYPVYSRLDLSGELPEYLGKWNAAGASFAGILTGYLTGEAEASAVLAYLREQREDTGVITVDPVMADNGKPYSNYSDDLCRRLREMAGEADIVTPNLTELMLLAGKDPGEALSFQASDAGKIEELANMARELICRRDQTIVVTGLALEDRIGNLAVTELKEELVWAKKSGGGFSGTGDLFAAVLFGAVLRGQSVKEGTELAAAFIEKSAASAALHGCTSNDGADFEEHLKMLLP